MAEQAIYREQADREAWIISCLAFGVERAALESYDCAAMAHAVTTVYPNHDVVSYCRHLAKAELSRGEPLPTPEQAIETENRRALAALIGGL